MSSKENKKIAEEVIAAIGGKENIVSLAHCATRLRIVVKDRKKVNEKALDKIDKAKGYFFTAGQYQIIFGTGLVNDVYEAVKEEGVSTTSKDDLQMSLYQLSLLWLQQVFLWGCKVY